MSRQTRLKIRLIYQRMNDFKPRKNNYKSICKKYMICRGILLQQHMSGCGACVNFVFMFVFILCSLFCESHICSCAKPATTRQIFGDAGKSVQKVLFNDIQLQNVSSLRVTSRKLQKQIHEVLEDCHNILDNMPCNKTGIKWWQVRSLNIVSGVVFAFNQWLMSCIVHVSQARPKRTPRARIWVWRKSGRGTPSEKAMRTDTTVKAKSTSNRKLKCKTMWKRPSFWPQISWREHRRCKHILGWAYRNAISASNSSKKVGKPVRWQLKSIVKMQTVVVCYIGLLVLNYLGLIESAIVMNS